MLDQNVFAQFFELSFVGVFTSVSTVFSSTPTVGVLWLIAAFFFAFDATVSAGGFALSVLLRSRIVD
jgi:hypothetical protein